MIPPLLPQAGASQWVSQLRVLSSDGTKSIQVLPLQNNEVALTCVVCRFISEPSCEFLLVSLAKDMTSGGKCKAAFIDSYAITAEGTLQFYHRTEVEEPVRALCAF